MTDLVPAAFIDRDGTIIAERSYLADPDRLELVPGAGDALADLKAAGLLLVTVTNQSGVARGLYSEADYHAVAERLAETLAERGVAVDQTEYCLHHPDVTGPCGCRKPATGMYLRAAGDLGIDVRRSYFIGDKATDVIPAVKLGGQGILVRTGYGREHEGSVPAETWVADDLRAAVDLILGNGRGSRSRPSRGR